jgi:acetyl esterase
MRAWRARGSVRTNANPPKVEDIERVLVPGFNGGPPVIADLITPLDAEPGATLFIHGGGWVFGDIGTHSRLARMLAVETKKRTLYIDYRLAPEYKYPAALDDSIAGWRWIVEKAQTDPNYKGCLAVSGDSAGGNLSMATILHEQAAGKRAPDIGLLFYGVYDDDFDTPSYKRFALGHGLARPGMIKFFEAYAPAPAGERRKDPLICPVRATNEQLKKLPPVYLNASGMDPIMCDTVAMAKRLEEAGATYEVNIHEGLHHGFMQQTAKLAESRRAFALVGEFYRKHEKR